MGHRALVARLGAHASSRRLTYLQNDTHQSRSRGHRPPGRRLRVERRQRAPECPGPRPAPPAPHPARPTRRRTRPRSATAPAAPPPPACRHPFASPSRLDSGAPATRAARPPGPTPCRGPRRTPGSRATSTSSCRPNPPSPRGTTAAQRVGRSPTRTAPSRTRGAGTQDHGRRRGCRWSPPALATPAPSTRCASPAAPAPNATPTPARRAATAATARSPTDFSCSGPRASRRAPPPAPASANGRTDSPSRTHRTSPHRSRPSRPTHTRTRAATPPRSTTGSRR